MKKYIAEMIGTMVLVLMGCGSAVFAGGLADTVGAGVGTIGVALAFGLSVVAMAYAIGGISGCHINPAITLGVFLTGRMNGKDAGMYMISQVIGAIIGSAILFALVSTGAHDGPTATGSNGFGDGEMLQAFIAEAVFTFIFVLVVLGSTDPKKGAGNLAGLAIGLTLVLVHIVCIIGRFSRHGRHRRRDPRRQALRHCAQYDRERDFFRGVFAGAVPVRAAHADRQALSALARCAAAACEHRLVVDVAAVFDPVCHPADDDPDPLPAHHAAPAAAPGAPGRGVFRRGDRVHEYLLSWLIGRSTKYSLVYGSLASVVILLFWFQAFGLLLILGVVLNHALEMTAPPDTET